MNKLGQKGVIHFLPLLLLAIGLIASVYLITSGSPLNIFPKAGGAPILFKSIDGTPLSLNSQGVAQAVSPKVNVEFSSPLGLPGSGTVSFRSAFNPADLQKSEFTSYSEVPTIITVEFPNKPGIQFYWVEFKGTDGKIGRRSAKIELVKKVKKETASSSPSPTSLPTSSPIPTPVPSTPASFSSAESFRDFIFSMYGFKEAVQDFIKANSEITVNDLINQCGGGGYWIPVNKMVQLNCTQHEAAVHELSHVWWHTYRLQNPDMVKDLARDVVRLADGDGSQAAVDFAKGYVDGIGTWKGMYCTDVGCADPHNIQDSDFDLTEATTNAKIIDWEIYAGFTSWTMGKFKSGSHALPEYMWKYFEPEFTGSIQLTPYYDGGHP